MVAANAISSVDAPLESDVEALIAKLTRAAYDVALRHTPDRPFTDLQFYLWRELQSVIQPAVAT